MSTFAELAALPSPGVGYVLEVNDGTTLETYSTVAGLALSATADPRIVDMGRLQRGFGVDGVYAAGTVTVKLDNTDGVLDWMTAPSTVATRLLRARFTLTAVLWDPGNVSDFATKVLGIFTHLDYPKRDDTTVTLSLADIAMGDGAELATRPTFEDWWGSNVPAEYLIDFTRQLPLVFGNSSPCIRFERGASLKNGMGALQRPVALYVTTLLDDVNVSTPTFWVPVIHTASGFEIPAAPSLGLTLFTLKASSTIAKSGKSWRVHWLELNVGAWWDWAPLAAHLSALNLSAGSSFSTPGGVTITSAGSSPDDILDALGELKAQYIWPASSRSFTTPPDRFFAPSFKVTAAEVAKDLLVEYSTVPVGDVETATFDAVRDAYSGNTVEGVITEGEATSFTGEGGSRQLVADGRLRAELRQLCQSALLDLAADWEGDLRLSATGAEYSTLVAGTASTLPRFEETLCLEGSVSVKTPSTGERWAPANRLFVSDRTGRLWGPYDNAANVTAWGRVLSRTINGRWWSRDSAFFGSAGAFVTGNPAWARLAQQLPLESRVRPLLSFQYGLEALASLELGDFFVMSVTRGGNTAFLDSYVDAIWRVESLTLHPLTGYVEVTAIWSSDVLTEMAYLLDDETLHLRVDQSTTSTISVDDDGVVSFDGAGSWTTAGVQAGDILVLQDSTEAATSFLRNRGIRVLSVVSAAQLQVEDVGDAQPSVPTWKVVRGKTTLPTSGGSYSDGSYMYGANAVGGVYTNSGAGNRFKVG